MAWMPLGTYRTGMLRLHDGIGHAVGTTQTRRFDDDHVLGAQAPCCALASRVRGDARADEAFSCRRALCKEWDKDDGPRGYPSPIPV